jgi:hypothetical protein
VLQQPPSCSSTTGAGWRVMCICHVAVRHVAARACSSTKAGERLEWAVAGAQQLYCREHHMCLQTGIETPTNQLRGFGSNHKQQHSSQQAQTTQGSRRKQVLAAGASDASGDVGSHHLRPARALGCLTASALEQLRCMHGLFRTGKELPWRQAARVQQRGWLSAAALLGWPAALGPRRQQPY